MPSRNQLGFRIDGRPRPYIAVTVLAAMLGRDVLVLAVDETPNLVAFQPLARMVHEGCILVMEASRAYLLKELSHGVDGNADHARGTAEGVPFTKSLYDLCSPL